MCKFDDDNAAGYEVVAEAILRYSRQAPAVITDRWVEEKNARTQEKKAKAREIYDGESTRKTDTWFDISDADYYSKNR
jgi:hypothetical protein